MPARCPAFLSAVALGGPGLFRHDLLGQVERLAVAALVVGDLVDPGVGELVLADQVGPSHLQRVELQGGRGLLHQPLHDQHDLRPRHAPVRRGGSLVGGDGPAARPVRRHLVHAGQFGGGHQRLDRAGEREHRVGAGVAVDLRVQPEDPAFGVEGGPDLVALLVTVEGGGQVLLAVLGPAHRPPQPQRGRRHGHLLPADHALQPEPAADIRRDHPDGALRQAAGPARRRNGPGAGPGWRRA